LVTAVVSRRPPSLLGNVRALISAQVAVKAVNVVVAVAMVRWLGAEELGRYAYVIAFAFPFGAVADFGLAAFAIRELSADPSRATDDVATLRWALLVLSVPAAAAMVVAAAMTGMAGPSQMALAAAGLSMVMSSLATPHVVLLTAREQLGRLSTYRVASSAAASLVTVAVLLAGGTTVHLLCGAAVVQLVMLFLARALSGAKLGARRPSRATVAAASSMIVRAVPFGVLMVVFALYYRIDMLMLEWMRGSEEVGMYAAAYRFIDVVIVLAASLGAPFYPRFSGLVRSDLSGARALLESVWRPFLALALPLSVGAYLVADEITVLLWGSQFAAAGGILRVLAWAAVPLVWVYVANQALQAANRVWTLAAVYAAGAVLNVALNLLLIPRHGAQGAAVATLICEWAVLAAIVTLLRRHFHLLFLTAGLWRYAPALLAMAMAVSFMRPWGLAACVAAGVISYGGTLWGLGYRDGADMVALRRLLHA
jgi:O-antigen/teichoic acid export membrane protein